MHTFDEYYKSMFPTANVHDFVTALENFPVVNSVFEKLKSMSWEGLNNVHSYDHTWSLNKKAGEGCDSENTGKCLLQASFSMPARTLMGNYGFTDSTQQQLQLKRNNYVARLESGSLSSQQQAEGRIHLWAYEEAKF